MSASSYCKSHFQSSQNFADEPTGALDSKSGAQIMELFQSLHEEGVTIIMITHDSEIASHAQRVIHIRDGQIAEQ